MFERNVSRIEELTREQNSWWTETLNLIASENLLPSEPLNMVGTPRGIRLGTQEMTRVGMKEPEMGTIAGLIKECLIGGKFVGDRVKELRKGFQKICYSFDEVH